MKIPEKVFMQKSGICNNGPITIVALGDSVTHGALSIDEFNYETVYWNRLRQKILQIRNFVPVNVINAGISGFDAYGTLVRMDTQVLNHNPDLIILCLGLNDVHGTVEKFVTNLREIFQRCIDTRTELIYMTPNMMNTYVADDTHPDYREIAARTAELQNTGKMDLFMKEATTLAASMGIPVCDCYAKWKELSRTQDITMLLSNRINHPTKEMHELFADSLFRMIFADHPECLAAVPEIDIESLCTAH